MNELDPEDLVLQTVLQIPGSLKKFIGSVEPIHFDNPIKRGIYALILGGDGSEGYYDPQTGKVSRLLWSQLDGESKKYVSNLMARPKTLDSDIEKISSMVIDKYRADELKRVVSMAEKRIKDGNKASSVIRESIGFLELLLIDKDESVFTTQVEAADKFAKKLLDLTEEVISPIRTPFESLDYLVNGGINYGDLVVVASRTNEGKSMLAGQWAISLAEQKIPLAIIGLEMEDSEYFGRELSHVARKLNRRDLSLANLGNPNRWGLGEDLEDTVNIVKEFDIHYLKNKMVTLDDLQTYCKYAVENLSAKAIIIDHSLLITSKKDQHVMVTELTNYLQSFAATHGVLCILVNQVNRDADETRTHVSQMAGGRSVEHAASLIISIDRLEKKKDSDNPYADNFIDTSNLRKLNVIKARNSPRDKFILTEFQGVNATFKEILPSNWQEIKNSDSHNITFFYDELN